MINSRGAEERMAIQDPSTQRHYPLINFRETNIYKVKPSFPKTHSSKKTASKGERLFRSPFFLENILDEISRMSSLEKFCDKLSLNL